MRSDIRPGFWRRERNGGGRFDDADVDAGRHANNDCAPVVGLAPFTFWHCDSEGLLFYDLAVPELPAGVQVLDDNG
ncbi:MAG: hypothetical protein H6685_09580 [Deltaproteobacteria bacterium]|nr:hypothetical protein [Deltaproteobacteria bacterium]